MGSISLTVVSSFILLVAYSVLISGVSGKLSSLESGSQVSNDLMQKRQPLGGWTKSYQIRRMKPLSAFPANRRDLQNSEVEFVDDSVNEVDKRFDDYGHMR